MSADQAGPGLADPLRGARIVVVCGPGGVGKTTTAAAIALRLAEEGARTIVLTVDPAKRLATALGLPDMPGDAVRIRTGSAADLRAMQLDTKRTFDGLVDRYAGSEERRDRILANRFYQRIAGSLAGTSEYMAMEKLHELASDSDHEAIVIDTPPTRSALSFLDAPKRMTDFLGGRLLRYLLAPTAVAGKGTLKVTSLGAQAFARTVRRIAGAELLADTAEFLASFEGMYDGFKRRAIRVLELLREPTTRFVVVTAPETPSLEEARFFAERLAASEMPLAAVVANRSHGGRPEISGDLDEVRAVAARLAQGSPPARALSAALLTRLSWQEVEAREAAALRAFASDQAAVPLVQVPEIEGDIHDLAGLRRVGTALFDRS